MKRRTFVKTGTLAGITLGTLGFSACTNSTQNKNASEKTAPVIDPIFFKFSLAQWSLHKLYNEQGGDPMTFAKDAKDLGFEGLEYVNQLYDRYYKDSSNTLEAIKKLTANLKKQADEHGMKSILTMIDNEGDLGIKNKKERLIAVDNHKKWIDSIKELGGHSVRINLFGDGSREEQLTASSDSMRLLGEYAKDMNINVLVENHGLWSSDPDWVVEVMKNINMPNVGTLPDFGNWCVKRPEGERWGTCIEEYPDYVDGVKKLMPYAKAVSAKSYEFNAAGEQDKIDYYKMMKVVKDAGYKGFIGVEYEGESDERQGILATKELLIKAAKAI